MMLRGIDSVPYLRECQVYLLIGTLITLNFKEENKMSTIIGYIIVGVITIFMTLASWSIVSKSNKDVNDDEEVK
jgi:hypothetical protein